jgi:glycosyltransferase involved in cell wall biosynthesis
VDEFRCAGLAAKIEQLLAGEQFDIVHVQRLFMSAAVPGGLLRDARARGLVAVLDVDDLESLKTRRTAASQPWSSPRRYLYWREYLKLKSYERRKMFDLVLVCSARDGRLIASHQDAPAVQVFANGADCEEGTAAGQHDSSTLLFLGAMNYQPNEDAVLHFHRSIFPLIRKRIPAARFVIAGKSPSAVVRALHNGRDTVVQGYVEDKAAVWNSCTVVVVPIRLGGGTRIKILEAMAARKPVVSTAAGAEGIDVTDGQDIIIGDSPEAFAAGCVELLSNQVRRDAIAEAGHELIARRYRWQAIRSEFAVRLKTLSERTRAADPQQVPFS